MPAKSRRSTSKKVSPKRTKVVWGALLAAMTGAAGMLFILDGGAVPRFDGLAMPALAATSGPSGLDRVFQTEAPLNRENWQAIVIHHSGAPYGTAESIDKEHRALGLDGLGFHFVIGNGSGLGDGEVHSGYRWEGQLPGAHAVGEGSEWVNRHSVGICLVGDGNRRAFTTAQMAQASRLVLTLAKELNIPAERIYLQSQLAPVSDPGWQFPEAAFREQLESLR